MTEEKKKPEKDEVTDELEEVAGGFLERFPNVPLKEPPENKSMEREGTIESSS